MDTLPKPLEGLAQYNQFIAYKLVNKGSKTEKKPINPISGAICNPHAPENWCSFETASRKADGVGFVLTENDPFFFLDIDKCKNGNNWSPLANKLLAATYGCAVEVSQSGTGLHIIGKGPIPEHSCKNTSENIELYTSKRFIALTGNNASGDVNKQANSIAEVVSEYFKPNQSAGESEWTNEPCSDWNGYTNDNQLIEQALKASSAASVFGTKASFRDLWERNIDKLSNAFPDAIQGRSYDESSADASLAAHLAYWTGKNCERTLALMERSALVRDKWERADYLPRTILNAARRCEKVHNLHQSSKYSTILEKAKKLDKNSIPAEIESLLENAGDLSPLETDKINQIISDQSGMPITQVRKTQRSLEILKNDDLVLAKRIILKLGADNIICTDSSVYKWTPQGMWKKFEDRAIKQFVQQGILGLTAIRKSKVESVTDLLKNEVYVDNHQFNIGPRESVNCLNGELILEGNTWHLASHNKHNYRTSQIPVNYQTKSEAPMFMKFLNDIFDGDEDALDKINALLEMIGYTCMSHSDHEKFIVLVGNGANGKSVLLNVIEALVGRENIAGVQPSQFDRSFQRAHLNNKLANIVTEIKQGETIDDASLKGIVSGEPSTVEHKHKDPFVMRPYATCWFGTNHMPHTRDFSDAVFRRALIIKFNRTFKPEHGNCDPNLSTKLISELTGILSLSLDRYAKALANGFTTPKSSIIARNDWRKDSDQVSQFIEECCVVETSKSIQSSVIFNAYISWANANNIKKTLCLKSFKHRMERLNVGHKRTSSRRIFTGISLKS